MLGRHCGAEGVGARELRGALLVEDVEFFDGEARGRQQVHDGPGEVASADKPLLQRVKSPLPAADPLIRGQPVLEEVQAPAANCMPRWAARDNRTRRP